MMTNYEIMNLTVFNNSHVEVKINLIVKASGKCLIKEENLLKANG